MRGIIAPRGVNPRKRGVSLRERQSLTLIGAVCKFCGDCRSGDRQPQALCAGTGFFDFTARTAGQVQRIRMLGSAAFDLVWLAEGKTDASIVLSNSMWDMTAGVVIACEAGARVVDSAGGPQPMLKHHYRGHAALATLSASDRSSLYEAWYLTHLNGGTTRSTPTQRWAQRTTRLSLSPIFQRWMTPQQ